jgi:hypothetical protein
MSIAGYLSSGNGELRMRRNAWEEIGGAVVAGPVTAGERSVEEALARDAIGLVKAEDERYRRVEEYDPVLRSHCRL